jgi:hypothetical protein
MSRADGISDGGVFLRETLRGIAESPQLPEAFQ